MFFRCGRTARVGSANNCRVTNFISTPLEIIVVRKIERAVRKMKPIPICDIYKTNEDIDSNEEVNEDIAFNEVNENFDEQEFNTPF